MFLSLFVCLTKTTNSVTLKKDDTISLTDISVINCKNTLTKISDIDAPKDSNLFSILDFTNNTRTYQLTTTFYIKQYTNILYNNTIYYFTENVEIDLNDVEMQSKGKETVCFTSNGTDKTTYLISNKDKTKTNINLINNNMIRITYKDLIKISFMNNAFNIIENNIIDYNNIIYNNFIDEKTQFKYIKPFTFTGKEDEKIFLTRSNMFLIIDVKEFNSFINSDDDVMKFDLQYCIDNISTIILKADATINLNASLFSQLSTGVKIGIILGIIVIMILLDGILIYIIKMQNKHIKSWKNSIMNGV